MRPVQPRIVPMGPHISSIHDPRHVVSNSARRLEVTFVAVNSPVIINYLLVFETFCSLRIVALIEVQKYVMWPIQVGYLTKLYWILTFLQLEYVLY